MESQHSRTFVLVSSFLWAGWDWVAMLATVRALMSILALLERAGAIIFVVEYAVIWSWPLRRGRVKPIRHGLG